MSNKQKQKIMKATLFVDSKKLTATIVKTSGRGFNFTRKEETFSIKKGVAVYGYENEVKHLAEVYKVSEVVNCEL